MPREKGLVSEIAPTPYKKNLYTSHAIMDPTGDHIEIATIRRYVLLCLDALQFGDLVTQSRGLLTIEF